jgi:3-oxoadipate enol-lactonase
VAFEVAHELRGPSDAPVLVLSGSLGTDRSMWDPQAEPLGDRFRVLRYDQRGHGASPVPPGPYSIADLGSDLLALLDRLAIERASLCGLSIGGMSSMWVAAHAPERVERVVLCCTAASLAPEVSAAYAERAATVREQGLAGIADAVVARWFTPRYRDACPDVVEWMRRRLLGTPPEGYAGCCEALAALDLRRELSLIEAPTLVLAGAEDPAIPPERVRLIADGVAGARFTSVPQAAHLASIERAELVTALMLSFLDPDEEEAL